MLGYQDFGTLENSTASGDVSNGGNDNDYMGGLVGQQHGGTTRNSIASGDVSDGGNGNDLMGGLVGRQLNGLTQNSLSLGSVSNGGGGTNELGGLVGLIASSTRTNLYWNTQTSGLTTPLGSGTCASPNCASGETATLTPSNPHLPALTRQRACLPRAPGILEPPLSIRVLLLPVGTKPARYAPC